MKKRVEKLFEALVMGITVHFDHRDFRLYKEGDVISEHEGQQVVATTCGIFQLCVEREGSSHTEGYYLCSQRIDWMIYALDLMTDEEYTVMCGNIGLNRINERKKR